MYTMSDMAKALNRAPLYLQGLQKRFELPVFKGAGYSNAYFLFLRTVVNLRSLNIPEETILNLWHIEKKLLHLLHADPEDSPTWFLNSCGSKGKRAHRLLLSNFDMGVYISSGTVQLGLKFADTMQELFTGREMGEDALSLLQAYLDAYSHIQLSTSAEISRLRSALCLAARITPAQRPPFAH